MSIVNTFEFDEDQDTWPDNSTIDPSLCTPLAVNCLISLTLIVALSGETSTDSIMRMQ